MAHTVLVVEDERKLRDFIRSYLERAGFTVLSTGSGAEAMTLAAAASPDLVVLDLGFWTSHAGGCFDGHQLLLRLALARLRWRASCLQPSPGRVRSTRSRCGDSMEPFPDVRPVQDGVPAGREAP